MIDAYSGVATVLREVHGFSPSVSVHENVGRGVGGPCLAAAPISGEMFRSTKFDRVWLGRERADVRGHVRRLASAALTGVLMEARGAHLPFLLCAGLEVRSLL